MHGRRGQTLPVWTFGIMTTLMLSLIVFNYANTVRWQIRAQNAADAVSQAVMSVQTQHYNQMLMTLHAAAVEEWRIRRTMNALLEVLQGSGGANCGTPYSGVKSSILDGNSHGSCITVYTNLRSNYIADVARYSQLVQQMAAITQYTQTEQIADMTAIANSFEENCTSSGAAGGDCAFKFNVSTPQARTGLSGVLNDAGGATIGAGKALGSTPTDLQPLEVEVIACAVVNSPFQSFFKLNVEPFTAIGRSAATSAMVTQEWFNPGVAINPNSGSGATYQPTEFPENATNTAWSSFSFDDSCNVNGSGGSGKSDYDWYAVHWCSNAWKADYINNPPTNEGFTDDITTDEYSVWTGWWSVLPVAPYSGAFTPSAANCAQNVSWNS